MTPKEAMYAALSQSPGIVAVCGRKVFPDQAEQGTEDPYLIFQVVSDVRPKLLRGVAKIRNIRFQLTGFCETRKQAESLATAIEELLDGKHQQDIGGLLVKGSMVSPDSGAVDEDGPPMPGETFGDRTVRLDVIWWV